ncbi:inverse autotransporter beta domain-containing protein [Citrobacter freundii]|uniref:inverse autotransporter beta domain-containing protein n=1 Tax=Citrobacter freundii TaxID=546 RepID=UPI00242EBAA0|nr:inverse autotransporter beta domain-containing protein [Citrobacter freundii]WFW58462.1 inverse autotransporter beta domain-containing protein [Citrobacter freundii]
MNNITNDPIKQKLFVWLNIFAQAALPLVGTWSHTAVSAEASKITGRLQNLKTGTLTQIYTTVSGDTAYSVARQFGQSPGVLAELNQDVHIENHEQFKVGTRLIVPASSALTLPSLASASEPNTETSADSGAAVASAATTAGSFFASSPDGRAASGYVRNAASASATASIQQWLNRSGTARVKLDVDEKFSLKNSQLEMLIPLYEKREWLLFSQGSVHRTDDRNQTNIGFGLRNFSGDSMLGASTFLDHDFSHGHTRLGVGAEYWRDFLKVSGNGYFRLSGWRESPNVEDYDERPANGWDIRSEAWVPALPQLGGKLVYEQYYGNEVALFGRDKRQKNPHAVTAGINYTPIPLVTFSAEHRQGASGESDSRIGVEFTVSPGVPWHQQVSPDAVGFTRSLAGSRYDLVDRNNNIVLEYRKREVIRLQAPARIGGRAQQVLPLTLSVQAKHGLKDIQWNTADLIAVGGKLTGQGTQWQLTLPSWKADTLNAWLISAVALDNKNNASKRAEIQVVLTGPAVSTAYSTLNIADERLKADGKSSTQVTVTLKDEHGQLLGGMKDQLILQGKLTPDSISTGQQDTPPIFDELKETSEGIYTTTLTAGTSTGTYTLSATAEGVNLSQASIVLEKTTIDLNQSSLTADKNTLFANGRDQATLTFSVKDNKGNPLSGLKHQIAFFIEQPTKDHVLGDIIEIQPGVYTTVFSGSRVGTQIPVGVSINGQDTGKRQMFDLTAGIDIVVTGNAIVGETLTASPDCQGNCGVLSYQWQIEDQAGSTRFKDIPGATSSVYKPVKEDQKRKIRVAVSQN